MKKQTYYNEEFFAGDEGDLAAKEWIEDMGLDADDYEMEWDYERKGYVVRYKN